MIVMTRSATHGYGHPKSGRIAVMRSCQSSIDLSPFPDHTAERTSQAQNRQRRIFLRVGRRRTGAILSREPGTLGSAFWGATAVSFSKRVDGQFNGLNFGLLSIQLFQLFRMPCQCVGTSRSESALYAFDVLRCEAIPPSFSSVGVFGACTGCHLNRTSRRRRSVNDRSVRSDCSCGSPSTPIDHQHHHARIDRGSGNVGEGQDRDQQPGERELVQPIVHLAFLKGFPRRPLLYAEAIVSMQLPKNPRSVPRVVNEHLQISEFEENGNQ